MRALVALIALAGCAQPRVEANRALDCPLAQAPRDAGVVSSQGRFAFVSPKALPQSYSGCQVMWDESGSPQYVLRFAGGDLQEFATYPAPAEKDKPVQVCRYEGGRLSTDGSIDCPSYDAMKGGIPTLAAEPQVPRLRDPRR